MRPSEVLASVHQLLLECGLKKAAKALAKEIGVEALEAAPKVPLVEAANEWLARQAPPGPKKRKRTDSKKKKEDKTREEAFAAAQAWQPKSQTCAPAPAKVASPSQPFSRLGDEQLWLETLNEKLKDNSYAAAFSSAGYGAKASQKLLHTRGKDFRHGKTKLKRKNAWGGGSIDLGSNSIKFEDNDE